MRGNTIAGVAVVLTVLALAVGYQVYRSRQRCSAADMDEHKHLFTSPLAGQWYTADNAALRSEINGYIEAADPPALTQVRALILPHAGYTYSGRIAAFGMKAIQGAKFRRVVVLGPSHHLPMENIATVSDATHCATPLGETALDTAFIRELKKHPEFQTLPGADDEEHSVQIQLPLLQAALGEFRFVPIVCGDLDPATARRMGAVLKGLMDDETLVVASSDFTHYGRRFGYVPFTEDIPGNLEKLDMGAYAAIEKKDLDGFAHYLEETGDTICGRAPISVLLAMLPENAQAHLLKYDTSGRQTGDFENSVSYVCAAFTGAWGKAEPVPAAERAEPGLSEADKEALLSLARKTIQYALEHQKVPNEADLGIAVTDGMRQVRAAFVTLEKDGELRGCIGDIMPSRPLYRCVMANALNAAFNDHRFPPVSMEEYDSLHVEISALTPPCAVGSVEDIVVGRDGVVLEKSGRSAVFLPQVAPEQRWDRDTMLTYLSRKAGLPEDAWKEGATFSTFQAEVFEEAE